VSASADKQKDVEAFWDSKPCGSEQSKLAPISRDYFREIEQERYTHQRHVKRLLSNISWRGKNVLEVGTGVGTDARHIISEGGIYTGINVDRGSTDMTAKALEVYAMPGKVRKCSATAMDFPDSSFDVVYSFGVLHHIPDVDRAVDEIHRVLKPGGDVLVMVYNKTSINYYVEIMFLRKLVRRVLVLPGAVPFLAQLGFPEDKLRRHLELYRSSRTMTQQEWLSRNTDGPENPFSKVYSATEAANLFRRFEVISNETYYFDPRHWGPIGRLLPRAGVDYLGRRLGWHRIIRARKRP
jgi:ubiquinone/menaquinone biosynthesis C-methylase UbiE